MKVESIPLGFGKDIALDHLNFNIKHEQCSMDSRERNHSLTEGIFLRAKITPLPTLGFSADGFSIV